MSRKDTEPQHNEDDPRILPNLDTANLAKLPGWNVHTSSENQKQQLQQPEKTAKRPRLELSDAFFDVIESDEKTYTSPSNTKDSPEGSSSSRNVPSSLGKAGPQFFSPEVNKSLGKILPSKIKSNDSAKLNPISSVKSEDDRLKLYESNMTELRINSADISSSMMSGYSYHNPSSSSFNQSISVTSSRPSSNSPSEIASADTSPGHTPKRAIDFRTIDSRIKMFSEKYHKSKINLFKHKKEPNS